MKKYGIKQTRGSVAGHQNCIICHPKTKSRRMIEKIRWKKLVSEIINPRVA